MSSFMYNLLAWCSEMKIIFQYSPAVAKVKVISRIQLTDFRVNMICTLYLA